MTAALAESGAEGAPAVVKQAGKPEFGHYQANGVMGAAKAAGMSDADVEALL